MTKEQWEELNPIIFGRYKATGYEFIHEQGITGQGVKIGIIDDFEGNHGHYVRSIIELFAPDAEITNIHTRNGLHNLKNSLRKAWEMDLDIVNVSISIDFNDSGLEKIIKQLHNKGVEVVCSAGNTGEEEKRYPASYKETFSIGSINSDFLPSDFSTYNNEVDYVFFGDSMPVRNKNGDWLLQSGTSFTAPQLVGILALKFEAISNSYFPADYDGYESIDLFELGQDDKTGSGFLTFNKDKFFEMKELIFGQQGLSKRVQEIKDLMLKGKTYEQAASSVNVRYHVIGYDELDCPIFGGEKNVKCW